MPVFETATSPLAQADAPLLVVGATRAPGAEETTETVPPVLGPGATAIADALGIELAAELAAAGFDGSAGDVIRVPTRGTLAASTVAVVGLGPVGRLDLDGLRRAAAAAASAAERVAAVATALPGDLPDGVEPAEAVQAVVEGFTLGAYRFHRYKGDATPHQLATVTLHAIDRVDAGALDAGIAAGEAAAAAGVLVRDLVNTPPRDKRPAALADWVVTDCEGTGVEVSVLDQDALAEGGYGGLLGVGAGSSVPPRLVELTWTPPEHTRHVALVGKGITFDSGGLSLKPNEGMLTMKMDMAGAATVLAVVKAAAGLALPVKVTGLLALAENMPSGTATRPSDVLTIRGGKTVDVRNTDAEGRLVLADALVHAGERNPDVIVDVATLTGAVAHALGHKIGAVMSTDDDLADALLAAAAHVGEPLWRLPVASREYAEELEGDVADLDNAGWKGAGTVRAGLFLKEFVPDGVPWAHLDIAGVAWAAEADGYLGKGATGVPARTLLAWLRR